MKNNSKILITAALPYANGPLHFGHIAGAYLPADCFARFERLLGSDVLFVCGSDEYGIAITLSAELAGRSYKEHVDGFHQVNQEFFESLKISFDHFSRTTWSGHEKPVHRYFLDLLDNGFIEEKVTDQLYSPEEDRFLADRYVVGTCPGCGYEKARGDECQKCGASYEAIDLKDPRSKLTDSKLIHKPTKHWFLHLEKFQKQLLEWIGEKKWKPNVLKFAENFIENLRPRAITRDMTWGVPVPLSDAEKKVLYVWFDAPIGYISASMEWAEQCGDPKRWEAFWLDQETKLVQFLGKDNIPFHAVIFPAMTMGQNTPYKLVDELPANEFYMLEGRQFSKSEGWTIDLNRFFQKYTSDQIRYTIAANAPETSDSEFTWQDFQMRCNAELLSKYGNFANRTLVFAWKHCEGKVPERGELSSEDTKFLEQVKSLVLLAKRAYTSFSLRKACRHIMELASLGNAYFDAKKPWKLAKEKEGLQGMQNTIALCLFALEQLALISSPVIPETATTLFKMLGFEKSLEEIGWETLANHEISSHQPLQQPKLLFRKIEDEEIEEEIRLLKSRKNP